MAVSNNFSASTLDLNNVVSLSQPTALVWGPDGRLYVTERYGDVKVLTVAFGDKTPGDGDATASFYVTAFEPLTQIKTIPNYLDDGSDGSAGKRQVTGIDVTAQYDSSGNAVIIDGKPAVNIYVSSSDDRVGAGTGGADINLDTNSGRITKLTQTQSGWDTVDLVRGLPRSEENHATNGMEVIQTFDDEGKLISERMIVASGGNANNGAPSNNFAGQQEQPYSAAILEIDLDAIDALTTQFDDGRAFKYDLPTLNDPTRDGAAENDPFGGNDGMNSAKITADSPVQIYSAGYRNAYDVEVSEDGRVWTYDNGANGSWGGRPVGEAGDNGGKNDNPQDAGYISTNLNNSDGNGNDGINIVNWSPSNRDNFHEVTRGDDLGTGSLSMGGNGAVSTYVDGNGLTHVYGGHPNPTRAEASRAGILFSPDKGTQNSFLMLSNEDSFGNGGDSDYDEVFAWMLDVEQNNADFPSNGIYGAGAGDLTKKLIAMTPGVSYDIYVQGDGSALIVEEGGASPGGSYEGTAGLPADIAEIVVQANPIEGDYKEAGKTDGALDTGFGSINGLAEYNSTILDGAGVKMSGAILASQLGSGGNIIVMGRNADGTMSSTLDGQGFALAADRAVISATGGPLGLSVVGDDYFQRGLSQAFQGSIWSAVYQGPASVKIEIQQPNNGKVALAGSEISDPNDQDLDGVDKFNDPFEFDVDNGTALKIDAPLILDFSTTEQNFPGSVGGTGFTGAALDGATANQDALTPAENLGQVRDGLFNLGEDFLPGGNAPIVQIKNVAEGSVVGGDNSAREVMHTGIRPDPEVTRIEAVLNVKNWIPGAGGVEQGQVTGMIYSDGTQSNFLRIVFGGVDATGTPKLEVGYELGDSNYTILATVPLAALAGVGAPTNVDLRLGIDMADNFAVTVGYRLAGQANFTDVVLDGGNGFDLPAGVLRDVLTGDHTISDGGTPLTSGAAIGILAEDAPGGSSLVEIDYNGLEIRGFGNDIAASDAAGVQNAIATTGKDTILYTGTDTALGTLGAGIEDFDGSGSAANFNIAGNDADNVITVGSGTNTVGTGGGVDMVKGTKATLNGDTITDLSGEDAVIVTDGTASEASVTYAAGSATVSVGGTAITFTDPDFTADGQKTLGFIDGASGLEIRLVPDETVLYRINAGNTVAALDNGPAWFGDNNLSGTPVNGVTMTGNKAATFSNTLTDADNEVDYDNVDAAIVPWQVFVDERGQGGTEYTFAVTAGTSYKIEYFYTENWDGIFANGPREFDVAVEGAVPVAFENLNPLAEAQDFVGTPAPTSNGASNAAKQPYLGVARKAEYVYTATDDTLNLNLINNVQEAKVNAIQITQLGGTFVPPADTTAPVIADITVSNEQGFSDGVRTITVVVTDNQPLDESDLAALSPVITGLTPQSVSAPVIALSNGDKTATLTYDMQPPVGGWPTGGAGSVGFAAGAFVDAADNQSAAASADFIIHPYLDAQTKGALALAINVGPETNDPNSGINGENKETYGGAITGDTILGIDLQADNASYYAPVTKTGQNIDGVFTNNGINPALDGSALHTYRDAAAGSFTATYPIANGVYVVELHFAELFWNEAGKRVGDYTINGELVAQDFDAFAAADALTPGVAGDGADTPVTISKTVIVTDGKIVVDVNADAGQPGFNAIAIYQAVDPNTPASVSVGDVSVAEGEDAVLTFTRSGNVEEAVTIEFTLTPGTADAADYTAPVATSVVIGAGQTVATIDVPIVDDTVTEASEAFTVTITSATANSGSVQISDNSGTVTIAASDIGTAVPVGDTIFELDFETGTDPLADGGFDGVLGGSGALVPGAAAIDAGTAAPDDGKLVVQTAEGDINQGGVASKNDFTKTVDLSDPALNEIFLSTRIENPFTASELTGQGITNGQIPQYAQVGIVFGTGTQNIAEQVKLVFGGVAGGTNPTGVQMWSRSGGIDQQANLAQMLPGGQGLIDIAAMELILGIDKVAGTVAQYVTLFDVNGTVIGGTRPVATDGFFVTAPIAMPAPVLANLTSTTEATHVGVTSNDYLTFASFEATWDYLRLSSPQFDDTPVVTPDSVDGVAVAGNDFSNDRTDPTDIGVLAEGTTEIVASQSGPNSATGRERDFIEFTVAEGQELTGIVVKGYIPSEDDLNGQGFIAIQRGSVVDFDQDNPGDGSAIRNLLGGYVYGSGDVADAGALQDGNILDEMGRGEGQDPGTFTGFSGPLAAGTYTIWLNQGAGTPSTVTLDLVTAAVVAAPVELSIADAPTMVEGSDDPANTTDLSFALTASDGFSGSLDVTYDIGTASETQTVLFTAGAGTLVIPVADDDLDTNDTTVTVTLTSATDTGGSQAIVISSTLGSASGTVTEDDIVEITYQRGDVVSAFNAGGPEITADGITFAAATDATNGEPFSSGQAYTDGDFGQPDQPVFDGTVYETEMNSGGDTDNLLNFSTAEGIDPTKKYFVDLYFAELFESQAGTRVFSVTAEGNALPELTNYNVVAASGDVNNSIIVQLNDPISPGANGRIDLSFLVGTERSKVNAVVIREAVEVDTTAVSVSVADVIVSEEAASADVVFTREGNTQNDMIITFTTADVTTTAGTDYTAPAQTVTILAGETTATVKITLNGDTEIEGDETFTVTIDSAVSTGATVTLADNTATVTLTDDDQPDPDDIDGDGILNSDDPFAYDGANGAANVLVAGGVFRQDFDTDTADVFSADGGFTGISVNPAIDPTGDSEADPYGDRTTEATSVVEGGFLKVGSSPEDRYGTGTNTTQNYVRDNYQSAADVSGLESFAVEAEAKNPFQGGSPGQYAALGITIGAGGVDDYVKLVFGAQGANMRVELADENSFIGANSSINLGTNPDDPALGDIASLRFRLEVTTIPGTPADPDAVPPVAAVDKVVNLQGLVTFLDAAGAETGSIMTPVRQVTGSLLDAIEGANPLTGDAGGMAYGVSITNFGSANTFTGEWDYIEVRALDNDPASVSLVQVLTELPEGTVDAALKIADIVITDDGAGTNDLDLEGVDAGLFEDRRHRAVPPGGHRARLRDDDHARRARDGRRCRHRRRAGRVRRGEPCDHQRQRGAEHGGDPGPHRDRRGCRHDERHRGGHDRHHRRRARDQRSGADR